MANAVNLRQIVMEMLLEMNTSQVYSHVLIRDVQNKYDYLTLQEKAFLKRLFEGTLERRIELDYILNQYSKVKVDKMKPVIRTIMRLSVYQIMYMDGVPDAAACNEAVKLANLKKFSTLKGFVNGVLRTIARNKEHIRYPDKEKDLLQYLSVVYSMPEWMIQKWLLVYDTSTVERLLQGLLEEHPVTIRMINEENREQILEAIKQRGIIPEQHPYFHSAYKLRGSLEAVSELPGFAEGDFTVQDVSSMLAVSCAGIKENDTVLDVCAAPGGKTLLAAQYAGKLGQIISRDVSEYKVDKIVENIRRCKFSNIKTQVWDARVEDESCRELADVVIADLPCSGFGVMGKKRDIKYHANEEALKDIVKLQKQILKTITKYVKNDGVLLYSTCTIHTEENEKMADWLQRECGMALESIEPYLPEPLKSCESAAKGYVQLLPGVHDSDGFFIARFRKVKIA